MSIIEASWGSIIDTKACAGIVDEMRKVDPVKLSPEAASLLVQEAAECAVGGRVCRALDQKLAAHRVGIPG